MTFLKTLLRGALATMPFRTALLGLAATLAFAPAQSALAHEYKLGDLEIQHPW